jgi:hypothetical protein
MKLSPLALTVLAVALAGCGASYVSLGTWYVDEPALPLVIADDDRVDTLATLGWGDSLEVLDAPREERGGDDHFLVRRGELLALAPRDLLLSDVLFRSKYSHGRPIHVAADGRRYFLDEFGDTMHVAFRREAAMPRDTAERREDMKPEKSKGKGKVKGKKRRK